jgi:hypothetical protein
MPRAGTRYLQHKEVAALVTQERWDELQEREVETKRGLVRNSAKQLLSYIEIMEAEERSPEVIARLRSIADILMKNPLRAGKRAKKIKEGYTQHCRLNPKQGQCLVPFISTYFNYEKGTGAIKDEKNPYRGMFIEATYKDGKIIISPVSKEKWVEIENS